MPGILRNLLDNLWGLATSDPVSITVVEPPPLIEELTISANKTTIETGEVVTFSGQYTIDGKGQAYKPLSLYVDGSPVMDMDTDANGYYSIGWQTPTAGTYSIYTKTG